MFTLVFASEIKFILYNKIIPPETTLVLNGYLKEIGVKLFSPLVGKQVSFRGLVRCFVLANCVIGNDAITKAKIFYFLFSVEKYVNITPGEEFLCV